MKVKKSPEMIKEEILLKLKERPKTITEISEEIHSNWLTTEKFLKELSETNKVRELISTEKKKVYQTITGDTYFDLPISEEEREKFRSLFYLIREEYRKKEKKLTKTHLAKCAVDVIDNEESGLSDLPTIWYLYGKIPQMIVDPSQEYGEEFIFDNKAKIQGLIKDYIDKNGNKGAKQIQKEQHKKYNQEMHTLADDLFTILNRKDFKNEEVLSKLNEFFIICPIDSEFPEVFDLTEKVFSVIRKLSMCVELQNYRKEVLLVFDSLWKFIALYKLYKSRTTGKNAMDKDLLLKFYVGNAMETRKINLQESFLELNEIYFENLDKFDPEKIEPSEEVKEIRKIMEDWAGED